MTFLNINFDIPGGIQQYQKSLGMVLREMAHDCTSLSIEECIDRLRTAGSRSAIMAWTILIHDPNQAESLVKAGVPLPRIWFFLHGDYDFYIYAAIRHHLWVDQVICVNKNTTNTLSIFWGLKNVTLLPPIIPSKNLIEAPKKNNTLHLVFVGRLEKAKGANLLISCSRSLIEQNINHKLTIIYSSHATDASIFEELVRYKHDTDFIEFRCDLNNKDVMECLSSAHAILLPSQKEGYPLSVAEAMSVGTIPIVAEYSPDVWNQLPLQLHTFIIDFKNQPQFIQATMLALNASSTLREKAMAFVEEKNGKNAASKRIERLIELPTISSARKSVLPIFRARVKFRFRKIINITRHLKRV